jgi:hypothetical protein
MPPVSIRKKGLPVDAMTNSAMTAKTLETDLAAYAYEPDHFLKPPNVTLTIR